MRRLGHSSYRCREVTFIHQSPCTTSRKLVRHHFTRGRALGRILGEDRQGRSPLQDRGFLRSWLVRYVPRRMDRTDANVTRWGEDLAPVYRRFTEGFGTADLTTARALLHTLRSSRLMSSPRTDSS